jgi:hypothetical protein
MPTRRYLKDQNTFEPETIEVMSKALEEACQALQISHASDREIIATRIIYLARGGTVDAKALSQRVISETKALQAL